MTNVEQRNLLYAAKFKRIWRADSGGVYRTLGKTNMRCDRGVNHLVKTEHIQEDGQEFAITNKGEQWLVDNDNDKQ